MASGRPERNDAAVNRERILAAARRLFAEQGSGAVSMDAVAAAAGVGKGTIFRRFGDRAGLTQALLDEHMTALQDEFLTGPPPLGPGAPPAARIEAFVVALVRMQYDNLPLALAADDGAEVTGVVLLHLRVLLQELDPTLDADVVATMLLGAIAPPVIARLRNELTISPEVLATSAIALLRGLTPKDASAGGDGPTG